MNKSYRIFLDDWRKPHPEENFIIVRTAQEFNELIDKILEEKTDWIETVSFDYTLVDDYYDTGLDCLKRLVKICIKYGLDIPEIILHSSYSGVNKIFQGVINFYQTKTDKKINFKYLPRF